MDIIEECERAKLAYEACSRWRVLRRRALCSHWLMCCSVLQTFEQARIAVQAKAGAA